MKIVLVHLSLSALAGLSVQNANANDAPVSLSEAESPSPEQDCSVQNQETENGESPEDPGCQSALEEILTGEPYKGGFREPCMS